MEYLCIETFYDNTECKEYSDGIVYDIPEQTLERLKKVIGKNFEKRLKPVEKETQVTLDTAVPIERPVGRPRK